jgi:beta-glucanase (GH16 family)
MVTPTTPLLRRRWRHPAAAAILLALAALASLAAPRPAGASLPPVPAGWTRIFSDDFNGPAGQLPSSANWLFDLGTSYPGGAPNWGTGEVETMTNNPANVSLDGGGNLRITPIRSASGAWTSARIETQRTDLAAPAGGKLRIEGRLQQPNVSGAAALGYWPAFWPMGAAARPASATNWPSIGEIDVMEDINGRSSVFGTLHCGTAPGGPCNENSGIGSGERACPGCQTGFHTYAYEIDRSVNPEQVRWYLDGVNYFTVNANQVDAATWNNAIHHGFFVILNVAIGGGFPAAFGGGPAASTVSGVPMLVDYVTAYTSGGGSPPPTTSPPPPTTAPPGGNRNAYATIQAESFNAQSGVRTEATTDAGGGQDVGFIANGDFMRYDRVDFGATPARQFMARVASGAGAGISGLVRVRLDSVTNPPVGDFAIANTGGWQSWRTVPANISAVTGVHDVFLTFSSGQPADFVNVNWFTFGH